ncbi:MAG: hypothetical protein HY885_16635 [Deltaproteobacteria bacterium]|nr:hypothetical protein [Deltaproteobacteria bacterium]
MLERALAGKIGGEEGMMGCQGKRMFWVAVLLCCLLAGTASARDLVSGMYISSAGKTIILDLEVLGPSTGNLIVHQFLPPQVDIVNSMPSAMKFDKNKGQVQWLMKKVKPGKVRITMELAEPLQPGLVRAEVRCRDQETGQMMDIRINP